MGLREIIAKIAGGEQVTWDTVGEYLRKNYKDNDAEKARREAARKRDEFYLNRGESHIEELICDVFDSVFNQDVRKKFIKRAKYNNFIKRIVNEKATVYSEPAKRRIAADTENYELFVTLVGLDQVMRQVNRMLALHEDVWVQYRVVQKAGGRREPVVDVVSPALFWAVAHPLDATELVAVILDQQPTFEGASNDLPHYRVICDDETFQLDGAFRVISSSVTPWTLGRMPGFIVTDVPASTKSGLLAECPNDDLVAAHESVWLEALLLLKESVSANRTTYASGDLNDATLGQDADTGKEVLVPEGTQIQSVDRGMDLSQFIQNAEHIGDTTGANHGVPPSVRRLQDATSGAEIHLRRISLHELRKQQIPVMRLAERVLAEIMTMVNAVDLPLYAFSIVGWAIDYGEIQQPLTPKEELEVYETERRLFLTDAIEEERRRNPDLQSDEEAWEQIKKRLDRGLRMLLQQRPMQALNGSVTTKPGDPTPQDNGAAGAAAAREQAA